MFHPTANLRFLLGVLVLCLYLGPQKVGQGEIKMKQTTHSFPKDAIQCRQGDYVISRTTDGKWKVFRIEDVVLLSRLVPLQFPYGLEWVEEKDAMDSARPAGWGEIHLLGKSFVREFATSQEATESIKNKTLGKAISDMCLSVRHFPKDTSIVYNEKK